MIIRSSEFVISAAAPAQFPQDGLPEIALAGRSNVGKSSLINRLMMRRNLARTSQQPGKTRTLNWYCVNGAIYFVDFPGYGYARVSKSERAAWGKLIENYMRNRPPLALVLLLIDVRHPPTADDVRMYEWLNHYGIPLAVVATKADKPAKSALPNLVRTIRMTLRMNEHVPLVLFSSETGLGRDELWQLIAETAAISLDGSSGHRV